MASQLSPRLTPVKERVYKPRGINAVQLLFKKYFKSFADQYEEKHATIYGRFRIKRITEVVEKFILCGLGAPMNPHYHCLVLEDGFDEAGRFVHIPFGNVQRMSEYFRRVIIKFFLKKKLISADLATNLINWRHSGFSVDNSARILDHNTQESLSEYIARPPISLKKIQYEPFQ